jgi:hypothetical protein
MSTDMCPDGVEDDGARRSVVVALKRCRWLPRAGAEPGGRGLAPYASERP